MRELFLDRHRNGYGQSISATTNVASTWIARVLPPSTHIVVINIVMSPTTMPIAVYHTLSPILSKKVSVMSTLMILATSLTSRRISGAGLGANTGVCNRRTTVEEEQEDFQYASSSYIVPSVERKN